MADAITDFAGLEEPVENQEEQVENPEIEGEQPESAEVEPSESTEPEQPTGPKNIRQAIRAASEAAPDQAQTLKELGNSYFREQAYKQHFETPEAAGNAKQLIESVGGLDGIAQLQERDTMYTTQDEFLRDGNPEILDDFFSDFPEGAAALAPHYLERLAKSNPEAFTSTVAPYAIGILENAGFGGYLQAIANEPDAERQKTMVNQLGQWYAQQQQGVKQMQTTAQPRQNPRLDQERQSLAEEREQMFNDSVTTRVNSSVMPEIQKTVDQTARQYGLNDAQKAKFTAALQNRLVSEMNGDETYKKQVELRKRANGRTADSVASYISGEFNRRLKDAAFKEAQETWGAPKRAAQSQKTGIPKAGGPKTATNGGPLFVSQRPPDSAIDTSRPNADLLLIQGRAYLKDGRFVTWRK